MKQGKLNNLRTRIDDLSPVGSVLSEENIESVVGGHSLVARSYAWRGFNVKRQVQAIGNYDFSDEPIIVNGGCNSSLTAKSCD